VGRAVHQNTSVEVVNCSIRKLKAVHYRGRKLKETGADVIFLECMYEVVVWYKYFINNFPFLISIYSLIPKGCNLTSKPWRQAILNY